MKKVLKIILGVLEVLAIAAVVCSLFIPAVAAFTEPYMKWIWVAAVGLTVIWVIIFCVFLFKKESGTIHERKIKFHEDRERNGLNIDERDTQDVYSNFERAEFATKVKEPYQKEVISYTDEMNKPVVAEEKVETAPVVEEVKEETPVVEEPTPVVEETPVEEPSVEPETVVEEPTPVVEEPVVEAQPEPVVEVVHVEEVAPVKVPVVRELKNVTLWEGFETEVSEGWVDALNIKLARESIKENVAKVKEIYESGKLVYPAKEDLLKPFKLTDFADVKVVLIGKIPFYRKNQADGLAYSTAKEQAPNQSTTVIINEAVGDVGINQPANGSLEAWAKKGVFLINSCLSAPADKPASHMDYWKELTDSCVEDLIKDNTPKVFLLWGEHAQAFKEAVEANPNHMIIEAPSPSPLSAANGFYNSKPFSKINEFLKEKGLEPIDWEL